MVSGVEVSCWAEGTLVWCVVVCRRERRRERERGGERRGRRREEGDFSLYSNTPNPAGLTPCRDDTLPGLPSRTLQPLSHTLPLHTPSTEPRPKSGGSPPSSPPGKGRKKGGKRGLWKPTILNFSLWGRTPRPPHSTGTRKKKTRKAGARVMLTRRTKSIDLNETSSTAPSVSP